MKRRDFLENTALGALLAPILAVFGLETAESPENGPNETGSWVDFARNHPDPPPGLGHIRVVSDSGHRITIEMAVHKRYPAGVYHSRDPGPPEPTLNQMITTERFTVGTLTEFEDEYLARVGSKPEPVDMYRVASALGVEPV